jgi:predicted nuclease of restriction endonuclease-like (RecB) superfamily
MEPSSTYTQELVKIISNTRDFIKDINNKHINIENIFYLSHLFYHIELASINNINLKVN